jgi:hypothetical protein
MNFVGPFLWAFATLNLLLRAIAALMQELPL